MDLDDAKKYFTDNYDSLYAGDNFLIDKENNVFECHCWANGGIWFVKEYNKETPNYYKLREIALKRKNTVFEVGPQHQQG